MASTKCHVCKDFYFHLFTAVSYNCLQPAWKGSKENEYRLLFLGGGSAGGISLISVANTKKGYIIREKQSPFHPSLCIFHCMYSPPPPFQSVPLCPPLVSFLCSIMAYWETSTHPYTHPPLPLFPFLSSTLSSSSSSTFFPPGLSLTFHFSLSHYSEGATMLWSRPSVMAHGLGGWEIANVAQMKY